MLAALVLAPALAVAQGAPRQPDAGAKPAGEQPAAKDAEQPAAKDGAARKDAGTPPSAARDLAKALTTPESWSGILDGYAASLAGQISGALAATGKEPPADLAEKVRGDLDEAVRYDQAIEMQARALSGRFAEDELRTLERFYRSGPGKKLLDALPEIARQVNDELRARLSERVPRIVQRYAPSVAAGSAGSGADEGADEPAAKPEKGPPPAGKAKPER